MHKDVIVSVSGTQFAMNQDDAIEIISAGERYETNGKTFVRYEEVVNDGMDMAEVTKNIIKLGDNHVELIKKGANSTHMVFEKGKNHMASYSTPLGNLMIGIYTKEIKTHKEEDWLRIQIEYSLDINYSHVSDCKILIRVVEK